MRRLICKIFLPPPHFSANEEDEEGNFGVIETILCPPSVHPPHPLLMFSVIFFFRLALSSIETKTTSILLHGILNSFLWTVGPHPSQIGCSLGFLYLGKQSLNLCCTLGWQHCLTLVCPQPSRKDPEQFWEENQRQGTPEEKGEGVSPEQPDNFEHEPRQKTQNIKYCLGSWQFVGLRAGLDREVGVGMKGKERERDKIIPKEGGGWENWTLCVSLCS